MFCPFECVSDMVVSLYSRILLESIRWITYGAPDDSTVTIVFEGRSRGFSTDHGSMLCGLPLGMWFREVVDGGVGDIRFANAAGYAHQWNRFDFVFLRPSHAYAFYELLAKSVPPRAVNAPAIPESVVEALRIDLEGSVNDDVAEAFVGYPNVVEDIPVHMVQFSRDFMGEVMCICEGFPETQVVNGIRRFLLNNPVFGTPESLWCAMYMCDSGGGPRAQVVGLKVDREFRGMSALTRTFFLADGERFEGDIGEESLVSRVSPFGEPDEDETDIEDVVVV
jgi:hypothetical protein